MSKHILVIDDDANIRALLELELSDAGYQISTADSALAGLQLLKSSTYDLVILDIKMPGMDGIEALEKIVATKKGLPVIIHSAYSHHKENYLTWSAVAYVVKSGDLTELTNKVQGLLGSE